MGFLDERGLSRLWAKILNKLSGKVDKVNGKGLSSNDYTSAEKTKVANMATYLVNGTANGSVRSVLSAEEDSTYSMGLGATALGNFTKASNTASFSEGVNTIASGSGSHAEGTSTTAQGTSSHAEGFGTSAQSNYQHVEGKYNQPDSSEVYAHIVGNGTSTSILSNAHTLDWQGNAWFNGEVYVGSTSGTNKDDGSKKLATEDYVLGQIAAITNYNQQSF